MNRGPVVGRSGAADLLKRVADGEEIDHHEAVTLAQEVLAEEAPRLALEILDGQSGWLRKVVTLARLVSSRPVSQDEDPSTADKHIHELTPALTP